MKQGWRFTGKLVPMNFYVREAYTRETNCLLKAVDRDRFRENPYWVFAARRAAAGVDDELRSLDERLSARDELERAMDRLSGTTWQSKTEPAVDDDPQFWLDVWDRLREDSPDDACFRKFTRQDLIDELAREAVAEMTEDETHLVKGYN